VPAVLLLHYYYYNYNALPCPRNARRANTTLLLRQLQLQHAALLNVLLLHRHYYNYKTVPCPPCYYYTTTTTNTMHCHICRDAFRATTTLILRQLQHAAVPTVLPLH